VENLRVVFLGTPQFAVPTLQALIDHPHMEVAGVVCQPDRPAGRGQKLHLPPVKELALAHGLPILQPEKLAKTEGAFETLQSWQPDLIVMVAFGQILKKAVLSLPPKGIVNLHGSLLPAYRGAAPINWAVINGDTESGITTMFTEAGVDTGPMLLKARVAIGPDMTAEELGHELSKVGAPLIIETLEQLQSGSLKPERQDDSEATFAPMLDKELGHLDWSKSAAAIHNLVRGLVPWPGTYTTFRESPLKIIRSSLSISQEALSKSSGAPAEPGAIFEAGKQLFAKCGQSGEELLQLLTVQPTNKGRMSAFEWQNGARITAQDRLGI
jgi:methionyl-tRNA formyltransferase